MQEGRSFQILHGAVIGCRLPLGRRKQQLCLAKNKSRTVTQAAETEFGGMSILALEWGSGPGVGDHTF